MGEHTSGRAGGDGPSRRRLGRRVPVIAGLAGLLTAGGLADRAGQHRPVAAEPAVAPVPVAAPAAALSSSWFCAGATAGDGTPATGVLAIANSGELPLRATVTLVPDAGPTTTSQIDVGAHTSLTVPERAAPPATAVGAIVQLDRGAAAVTQVVDGPGGASGTPCATSGSPTWLFPTGETLVNATEVVALLNPYPTEAVVDLSFTTDQGQEAPGDFQGLIVPPGGLLPVDLRSHLRRRTRIATSVHARAGRVVAFTTQVVTAPGPGSAAPTSDPAGATTAAPSGGPAAGPPPTDPSADPADPAAGTVVTLGAPGAAAAWTWPDGISGPGLDERYTVYNPSGRTAEVSLAVALDQGQAQPFALEVGPGQVTTIDAGAQARIPAGIGHSASLRSTNGVGVVAARTLAGVAPSSLHGQATLIGLQVAAPTWLVPVAAGAGATADLVLLDPGIDPLDVTVEGWHGGNASPVAGLTHLTLVPGQRTVLPLSAKAPGYTGAVVVRATGPVDLESNLSAAIQPTGIWLQPAVPLT